MAAHLNRSRWHSIGLAAALIVLGVHPAFPQTEPVPVVDPAYVPTMTFDVASVRETHPDEQAGFMIGGSFTPQDSSHLRLMNNTLLNLVLHAYPVAGYQVEGIPRNLGGAMFDVEAKSDSATDERLAKLTKEQMRLEQEHMFQVLLADRFKLKVHWETREGEVYDLVVEKGGPKLAAAGSMPPTPAELRWMGASNGGDVKLLPIHQQSRGRGYEYIGHSCSMDALVANLAEEFGAPVIDKTGLTGKYDFRLTYRGQWERDRPADSTMTVPTLDRAIESDLGLKVERAKGPVKVLVIDHIEKPSEN